MLLPRSGDRLCTGVDFNFAFNSDQDNVYNSRNFRVRNKCLDMRTTLYLVDIWLERNPPKRKSFTWFSNIIWSIHCGHDFFILWSKVTLRLVCV